MATSAYSSPYGAGKYESARRGIENQYTGDSAMGAYGRFLGQQRGQRTLSDTTRNFQRGYPSLAASYGARGLSGGGLNSGVRSRGVGEYVGDYYRDFGRQQQDLANTLQGYDLSQAQRDAWREEELRNLELQQAYDVASAAQQLSALRDYLGGI